MVRTHVVETFVGEAHQFVLSNTGLQRFEDVLIDAVYHRRRLAQQHQLVLILDLSRVEHELLGVTNLHARALQFKIKRQFHDVEANRLVEHSLVAQDPDDLLDGDSKSPAVGAIAPRSPSMPARQLSGSNQGANSRWWRAADPKSHTIGSPVTS